MRPSRASAEHIMASDADWVEDVRRWYFAGRRRPDATTVEVQTDESDALGYEAACPPLQAPGWPDAPAAGTAASTHR
jgi:hypothetical protein